MLRTVLALSPLGCFCASIRSTRPSTYLTYHGYIENHIKPQLGKIPLNDLTTLHLQQFYKKLLAEGRVERIEAQKQPRD